ncbi:unnamed protein product [Eruca vesicaria subsp. sativa]|uniref:Uncharacterized protein n=1 Tax=Eruca vesicaria subsp. sativa TaxID=29727 RepID=A0ABC8JKS9_ERUVS|nr:unnamed protein product [Eruca vesicaria subsp. sativa]
MGFTDRVRIDVVRSGKMCCALNQKNEQSPPIIKGFEKNAVTTPKISSTTDRNESATQRKIKQQYDHLVKCNSAKGLTLAQVGEFANCLIETKNELQNKSEIIKRKFSITKDLLFKADRSSFVFVCVCVCMFLLGKNVMFVSQQIYKLEMERKKVEEDALVYNWLQQQLKLSPTYKKVLEISASMELKEKSSTELDNEDDEFSDISFEELLEQEKKDSFWLVTLSLALSNLLVNQNYLLTSLSK